MPIAILSVDSINLNLNDFRGMEKKFDVVYYSVEANDIVEKLSEFVEFNVFWATSLLGPAKPEEKTLSVYQRVQTAITMIKELGVQSAMIVSHDSALKIWNPDVVSDTWEVIEM